jgi:hypothetical protein
MLRTAYATQLFLPVPGNSVTLVTRTPTPPRPDAEKLASARTRRLELGSKLAEALTPVLLKAHVLESRTMSGEEIADGLRMIRKNADEARLLLDELRQSLMLGEPDAKK